LSESSFLEECAFAFPAPSLLDDGGVGGWLADLFFGIGLFLAVAAFAAVAAFLTVGQAILDATSFEESLQSTGLGKAKGLHCT